MHLKLEREVAHTIADRVGITIVEAEQRLEAMAAKGLIFSVKTENTPTRYHAVPWVVGIYEFQVNRLNKAVFEDLIEYRRTMPRNPRPHPLAQMRTIPVGQSIEGNLVLQPSNSREISFLCTCCGCCCGALLRLKQHPQAPGSGCQPLYRNGHP